MKQIYYIIYEYCGETASGRWLRKKVIKKFNKMSESLNYLQNNPDKLYFLISPKGLYRCTPACIIFIKEQLNK